MNLNFDFGIQGKVKYELTDTRTGEVEVIEENNMLLDSYLDSVFNSQIGLLDDNIFDTLYVGDSDVAPARSQTGLQGNQLASSGTLEKVENNLGLLIKNWDNKSTFTGHSDYVNSANFHPDPNKNLAISGGRDNIVRIFEYDVSARTATEVATFTGHSYFVMSANFHPDTTKNLAISGSYDNTVKIFEYDVSAGTTTEVATLTGHSDVVNSVNFHPDTTKNLAISGSNDDTAKIFEYDVSAGTTTEVATLTGHRGSVMSANFHPDPNKNLAISGGYGYDETARIFEYEINLLDTAKIGYKFRFNAGTDTSMLIKEIVLRSDYGNYNAERVARQVPTNPIDKKDYHQLDITWTIEVKSPNIYYNTAISDGQRDGTSIDIDVEIANIALGGIAKYNLSSLDTFFGISGTPQFALGTSNTKKYPNGTETIEQGISLEGTDISGGFIAPFEVTADPYTVGSYQRTFRVGLESDQGNHADGLGEIILRNSNEDYFGRVLFDPPLDKVNSYRFYFDVTFSLNPS